MKPTAPLNYCENTIITNTSFTKKEPCLMRGSFFNCVFVYEPERTAALPVRGGRLGARLRCRCGAGDLVHGCAAGAGRAARYADEYLTGRKQVDIFLHFQTALFLDDFGTKNTSRRQICSEMSSNLSLFTLF